MYVHTHTLKDTCTHTHTHSQRHMYVYTPVVVVVPGGVLDVQDALAHGAQDLEALVEGGLHLEQAARHLRPLAPREARQWHLLALLAPGKLLLAVTHLGRGESVGQMGAGGWGLRRSASWCLRDTERRGTREGGRGEGVRSVVIHLNAP